MRWKKMVSALLIGAMVCTMGACGSSGSKDSTQGGSKTSSKGDVLMKIAVPFEDGQVFQHFGRSAQFRSRPV